MDTTSIDVYASGRLVFREKDYKVALGKSGVVEKGRKHEGDGGTPSGCYDLRLLYYRPDVFTTAPHTKLQTQALRKADAWCDDSDHEEYNTLASLPHQGSHEKLWREDHLYNLVIPIGYNDNPPVPLKGSAIFMHIARESYTPTEGCIALSQEDFLEIIAKMEEDTKICIHKSEP